MNEKEIREILISYLASKHSNEANLSFIKELFVNNFKCRADLVMANGILSAFEIKSEFDKLNRLPEQLKNFTKFFEEVTVVCAKKHLKKVLELTNIHIGIWLMHENKIKIIRHAKKEKLTKNQWLSHLPVDELRLLLKKHNLSSTGIREYLVNKADTKIAIRNIRSFVIDYFKKREQKINLTTNKNSHSKVCPQIRSDHSKNIELFLRKVLMGQDVTQVLPRKTTKNRHPHPIPVHWNLESVV